MKIALINGSPKVSHSASASLLTDLKSFLSREADLIDVGLNKAIISEKILEELKNADALVFAYPLYVDGIPAHLLSCLMQLENTPWSNRKIHVYGIANCGFYEGIQTETALKILQNWCIKTGLIWGGGVGTGGGGALAQLPDVKNGHGPKAPIEKALRSLADSILRYEVQKNNYVTLAFPRFLYKTAGQMGWRQMMKQNGGNAKDLGKQPLTDQYNSK